MGQEEVGKCVVGEKDRGNEDLRCEWVSFVVNVDDCMENSKGQLTRTHEQV